VCSSDLSVSIETIEIRDGEFPPVCSIGTKESAILIGSNGEHLRALNMILKKVFERRLSLASDSQFLVDVNGYYGKRLKELKNHARMLADRARMFKSNVEMQPMNAYERMIIHATFANDPEIKTESEGEGKFRRVVLKYRSSREPETTDSDLLGV